MHNICCIYQKKIYFCGVNKFNKSVRATLTPVRVMKLQLRKIFNESGILPTDILWEVSTLHFAKGKRHVSSVLISDRNAAFGVYDKTVNTLVETETDCKVIKECTKVDRQTGDPYLKNVVYSVGDADETIGITVKNVTVY